MQCKADKEKYSKKVQRRHVAQQELRDSPLPDRVRQEMFFV